MVQRKDIASPRANFLSHFNIFICNEYSIVLMSNLVSTVKSLLIELSSDTKYEYVIGFTTQLAKIAYSVINIIYTYHCVPATLLW